MLFCSLPVAAVVAPEPELAAVPAAVVPEAVVPSVAVDPPAAVPSAAVPVAAVPAAAVPAAAVPVAPVEAAVPLAVPALLTTLRSSLVRRRLEVSERARTRSYRSRK